MEDTHGAATNVYFWETPEALAIGAGLDHRLHCEVHPCVAIYKHSVDGVAVFELYEHCLALRGRQEAQGKLEMLDIADKVKSSSGTLP